MTVGGIDKHVGETMVRAVRRSKVTLSLIQYCTPLQ